MPEGRWEEVLDRDGDCQGPRRGAPERCGGKMEVHHLLPRGMGGTSDPAIHDLDNLMLLCSVHHAWVESHRAEAYELGLLKRRGAYD